MSKLLTRSSRLGAVMIGVMSVSMIAAPGMALAGNCTTIERRFLPDVRLCGNVRNHSGNRAVTITNDWGRKFEARTWRSLPAGKDGPDINVRDIDGFFVPGSCKFTLAGVRTIGPGWHKVRDGQNVQISSIRC